MRFELDKIEISKGFFQVQFPESTDEDEGKKNKSILVISCEFSLINKRGHRVAGGVVTNSPHGLATHVPLSKESLRAFGNFFNSLEHDIAATLEGSFEDDDKADIMDRLVGKVTAE